MGRSHGRSGGGRRSGGSRRSSHRSSHRHTSSRTHHHSGGGGSVDCDCSCCCSAPPLLTRTQRVRYYLAYKLAPLLFVIGVIIAIVAYPSSRELTEYVQSNDGVMVKKCGGSYSHVTVEDWTWDDTFDTVAHPPIKPTEQFVYLSTKEPSIISYPKQTFSFYGKPDPMYELFATQVFLLTDSQVVMYSGDMTGTMVVTKGKDEYHNVLYQEEWYDKTVASKQANVLNTKLTYTVEENDYYSFIFVPQDKWAYVNFAKVEVERKGYDVWSKPEDLCLMVDWQKAGNWQWTNDPSLTINPADRVDDFVPTCEAEIASGECVYAIVAGIHPGKDLSVPTADYYKLQAVSKFSFTPRHGLFIPIIVIVFVLFIGGAIAFCVWVNKVNAKEAKEAAAATPVPPPVSAVGGVPMVPMQDPYAPPPAYDVVISGGPPPPAAPMPLYEPPRMEPSAPVLEKDIDPQQPM